MSAVAHSWLEMTYLQSTSRSCTPRSTLVSAGPTAGGKSVHCRDFNCLMSFSKAYRDVW